MNYIDIQGYEGYKVNTKGDVISYRKKNSKVLYETPIVLKQYISNTHCKQYKYVVLSGKKILLHRLIALTFIPNPLNKPQVNHIDGNSLNNDLSNLEWATNSENQIHRYKLSGTGHNLGQYVHKNRTTYRVFKKNFVDQCFKDLQTAQQFAKQYY